MNHMSGEMKSDPMPPLEAVTRLCEQELTRRQNLEVGLREEHRNQWGIVFIRRVQSYRLRGKRYELLNQLLSDDEDARRHLEIMLRTLGFHLTPRSAQAFYDELVRRLETRVPPGRNVVN